MARQWLARAVICAATALAVTGCGNAHGAAQSGHGQKTVTVFAASSLSGALEEAKREFAAVHPGLHIRLNVGGSSTLVTQLKNGAPADLFASADEPTMDKAVEAGLTVGSVQHFAGNVLSILVQKGNPHKINGLVDLSREDLTVSLCGPQVPAGRYARQALERAKVPVPRGGEELDVKQVVSRVTLGEADAGIVYATDAKSVAGKADEVTIADDQNIVARYPASVLNTGDNPAGAKMFLDYLLSADGKKILQKHGFQEPR
ncbi:molybdate ABC transporter substrate-binding protein [Couchioplanes caeruleus]|uniref:Molybdate ABC transporter substrate-binding protein n=2 Tax=Couchioplanes caeruleus TaxID=56438 RepID=A0A1K0GEG8_9ACTN|nr:molybdate ABC transporter substrate-binding protein [Couchioplanes caeruleus]OJF10542.1 molybdate ABC transporter substrate-binding protein [Couchioplanes caeruleus subsp. caeruleus]ROP28637.1 molybdate transport system substrate-binding protein [Couchioplanes caeruleus]